MIRPAVPAALALFLAAAWLPALAAESVYTDTKLDTCETLLKPSEEDADMGNAAMKCPGYKGYAFYFNEYDVRQSTYFGYLSREILDGAGETFEVFNHIGGKIEWRLDGKGIPRATILRYTLENVDPRTSDPDPSLYGQVLVVSRVGQPEDMTGCVTAYVDALANRDANEMAREVADTVTDEFTCRVDVPKFHGERGPLTSEPMRVFEN